MKRKACIHLLMMSVLILAFGSMESGQAQMEVKNSTGTVLAVIDQTGNMGLGTETPAAKLDVIGTKNTTIGIWNDRSTDVNLSLRAASTATTATNEYALSGSVRMSTTLGTTWLAHYGVMGSAYDAVGSSMLSHGALGVNRNTSSNTRDFHGVLGVIDANGISAAGSITKSAAVHGAVLDNNPAQPNIFSGVFTGAPVQISNLGGSGNVFVYADNSGTLIKGGGYHKIVSGYQSVAVGWDPATGRGKEFDVTVNFGTTFSSAPYVICTLKYPTGDETKFYDYNVYVQSVTSTSFIAGLSYSDAQGIPNPVWPSGIYWMAIGN
ncbi:H-type lectin domain-containing protein [candidate division KSB1 bacterium]|nr:H-type lectin domain-containing protein [candidate division KSB1 bacterium]